MSETCGDYGGTTGSGKPCSFPAARGVDGEETGRCFLHLEELEEVAESGDAVRRPRDWDKAVAAAYIYLLTDHLGRAAEHAGVGERTIQRWHTCSWWRDACAEARERWLDHVDIEARRSLARQLANDELDPLKLLERLDPSLAPAEQRLKLTADYLHVDEVGALLEQIASDVLGVVQGEAERAEIQNRIARRFNASDVIPPSTS